MANSQPLNTHRLEILGVMIDSIDRSSFLKSMVAFASSGRPHQICTVNAEFIMTARKDEAFRQILNNAELNMADGVSIMWASRWLGQPLPERLAGADLVEELAALASQHGWSLYLVGGEGETASKAAAALKRRNPNLKVIGAESGLDRHSSSTDTAALCQRIASAKPTILLVAFGAPKQELFIAKNKSRLAVPIMIGVGGTFDYLAGNLPRAPRFLRQLGLEWLWRLTLQPKRLGRILTAVIHFPLAVISQQKSPR